MSAFQSTVDRIRKGGSAREPLDTLLALLTPIWRAGMIARKMRVRTQVDAHVVSIGNLTVGGTGKTPAVIERAEREVAAGRKVAVLTRGYGSRQTVAPVVFADGDENVRAEDVGDEPYLIARRVPGVIVVKASERSTGAVIAVREHGCDLLILDDGFQYIHLVRNEDILLVDASNPFGNGSLMPRGILREPLRAMKRATQIVLTHCNHANDLDRTLETIALHAPGVPVRKTIHRPLHLVRVHDRQKFELSELNGVKVKLVCAIGNPESFARTVESLGAVIAEKRFFRDHAHIRPNELDSPYLVLITEKDAVRFTAVPENVFALAIGLSDM